METEPLSRQNAIDLTKSRLRIAFKDEINYLKATSIFIKRIIKEVDKLDIDDDNKQFLKTERFKDVLYLLISKSLPNKYVHALTNYHTNDKYMETLNQIKIILFQSLLSEITRDYSEIAVIISSYIDYVQQKYEKPLEKE